MLQVKSLVVRVENLLERDRFGWVDLVTCRPKDRLDVALVKTAERGYDRIVVAALSVADSRELDIAKSSVDTLRPEEHALSVMYAAPLWSSDPIIEMLADRIWQAVGADPESAGVALLMHGQPEAYEQSHATFDVQENAFCNRIRMLLVERGLPETNVRLCSMDWRLPDVTETARHLAALGCTRVVVSPACFPFESISTVLDLPVQTRQARLDESVFLTVLAAWGDDPVVADALASAVRTAAHELD
jgi:protoheme ferro-lyase